LPWLKLRPNGLAFTDGYTLLLATSANASNTTLYEKLSFNFIHDITPVASIARVPLVMEVHQALSRNDRRPGEMFRIPDGRHADEPMTGMGHERQSSP
jgi:hypothetical protein